MHFMSMKSMKAMKSMKYSTSSPIGNGYVSKLDSFDRKINLDKWDN